MVRTVFAGDSIESFDAEIVGVLQGGRAEGDLILAKPVSDRMKHLGVAAGMSGSPVYVDGKLVGALAYGWPFSRDAVFGVTPIGEMLPILDFPDARGADDTAGPTGVEGQGLAAPPRFGAFRWSGDEGDGAAAPVAPAPGVPRPLVIPISASGLAPQALEMLARSLAPMGLAAVRGGQAPPGARPARLEPGSAVAVDVMRGDLRLSAIGTVTYRDGDRVLIFGHPFFQAGDVRLPMSGATIATILASEESSFKMGMPGATLGAVTQDRRTGVGGRIGAVPRLLPVTVAIEGPGARTRRFRFESIEDRSLAPLLIGTACMNSLLESGGSSALQTVHWELILARHGVRPLVMHDVAVGEAPVSDFTNAVSGPLRFLFNNPFERLALDSVSVRARVEPGRELWTLRTVRTTAASVRPGGTLNAVCEIESWRGGMVKRAFSVPVPEELPDGRYLMYIGGGAEFTRYEASKLPARYRPTSLDDAWRRFGSLRTSDALYAALFARAPEVTREGIDYPELPTSALSMLVTPQNAGDSGRRGDSAVLGETRIPFEGAVRGELLVQVQVDSHAPPR